MCVKLLLYWSDLKEISIDSCVKGATTISIMTLRIMTLSIITFSIMTLSIITFRIMTLSKMVYM
jgi:hypothetical protein